MAKVKPLSSPNLGEEKPEQLNSRLFWFFDVPQPTEILQPIGSSEVTKPSSTPIQVHKKMPQATKEKLTSKERLTEKPPVTEHVRELTYGENAPGQAGFSPDPEDFSLENPESETGTINSRW